MSGRSGKLASHSASIMSVCSSFAAFSSGASGGEVSRPAYAPPSSRDRSRLPPEWGHLERSAARVSGRSTFSSHWSWRPRSSPPPRPPPRDQGPCPWLGQARQVAEDTISSRVLRPILLDHVPLRRARRTLAGYLPCAHDLGGQTDALPRRSEQRTLRRCRRLDAWLAKRRSHKARQCPPSSGSRPSSIMGTVARPHGCTLGLKEGLRCPRRHPATFGPSTIRKAS